MMFIFAAGFALVGGLFVFSSYAYSRPSTLQPGTYTKAQLAKDGGANLRLHLEPGKQYCFESSQIPHSLTRDTQLSRQKLGQETCFSSQNPVTYYIDLDETGATFTLTVR